MEHVVSNTAGITAGKVLLPNLQGELLAGNPRAGNLSLMQAQVLRRVSFYISCSVKLSKADLDKCFPDGINHGVTY
jgi:hypothetical protein